MMLLNTQFNVDVTLDRNKLLELISNWLETSQYYNIDISKYDQSEEWQNENEDGTQKIFIGNYDDIFAVQFIIVSDTDASVYTTTYVLDDKSETHSIHLSQDKSFTEIQTQSAPVRVNLPNVLKDIFWHELGGYDNDILTDDKPFILRRSDVNLAKAIILDEVKYLNPIVYVSPSLRTGHYNVNCDMLAQQLMGQAHVVVEGSPVISNIIKDMVDGKNPFNGAVCIYVPGGKPYKLTERENSNFNYDVINAVRNMLVHVDIEDKFNFDKIRRTKMLMRLGDGEMYKLCDEMLSEKDNIISQLKKELNDAKSKIDNLKAKADNLQSQFDKSTDANDNTTLLTVTEKDLYDGEIVNVVLKVLQKEYDAMKGDVNMARSRKCDVLKDILDHNFPCTTDTELIKQFREAFDGGSLTRYGIGCLQSAGFVVEKGKDHYKITLNNDDRYMGVFATTPSDCRSIKNGISDFVNLLFGY